MKIFLTEDGGKDVCASCTSYLGVRGGAGLGERRGCDGKEH